MTTELPGLPPRPFLQPSIAPEASSSQLMRPKQRQSQSAKAFLAQQNISFDAPPVHRKDPKPASDRLRHRHENSTDVLPKHSRNTDMGTYGRRLVPTLPSPTDIPEQPILSAHDHRCRRYHTKKNPKAVEHLFVLDGDNNNKNLHAAATAISYAKEPLVFQHDQQIMKRDMDAALSDALVILDVRPPQRSVNMLQDRGQGLESVKSAFAGSDTVSAQVDNSTVSAVGVRPLRTIGLTPNTHLRDRFGCYTEK